MKKLLIFIIIIILAGSIGLWLFQGNNFSKEILKLEILGPDSIKAGEQVKYTVRLKNNGSVRLEDPQLVFQFPEKSFNEKENDRVRKEIETIYPGEERTYSFTGRPFGKKGEIVKAKAWITFRPSNLKTQFEQKTSFPLSVKEVPITFNFDLPSKSTEKKKVNFSVNYFSHTQDVFEDLRVKLDYPEGFEFESSDPQGMNKKIWDLPQLANGSGGKINIEGALKGEAGDTKIFKAKLGVIKNNSFSPLKEISHSVKITNPSLHLSALVNNSRKFVASPGEMLHYEIFFANVGDEPIRKKFGLAKLQGDFFDLSSLRSTKGEFGQGDNTILWDWKDANSLKFLGVQEEGKLEFWIKAKEGIENKIKNPELNVETSIGGTEKTFATKLNSSLQLAQEAYFNQDVTESDGPVPSEVGKTTKYVVFWKVKNKWNKIKNAKVKAKLAENVEPTGKVFPEDANFTYDSESKELLWNIEEIPAFNENPKTVSFQVEFTPSASQRGKVADLVKEVKIEGEDAWTSDIIEATASSEDTQLEDDETIDSSGKVK